jgi:RimJ/RimL family protein N-acetyltransferase
VEKSGLNPPIETERLWLRKYEDKDWPDIPEYSLDADFCLARNLDWVASEKGVKEYWEAQQQIDPGTDPKWFSLVVALKGEGKVIGHVGIGVIKIEDHRQGTIGWLLGRKYQRQGFATEAVQALLAYGFEQLGLHRITAHTAKDNRRSWYLMERLGMRREAHFRESHIVKGEWRDEYIYAILADEWRVQQGQPIY